MEDLKEVVDLAFRGKLPKIELLERPSKSNSTIMSRLLDGIFKGKINNDQEAAHYIFKSTPNDPKYKMLKKRFRERLYTNIFFIEPQSVDENKTQDEFFKIQRNVQVANILAMLGANNAANKLFESCLDKALEYEFFDIVIVCSVRLRREVARLGDLKKYNYYNELAIKHIKNLEIRTQIEHLYLQYAVIYFKSPVISAEMKEQITQTMKEVDEISHEGLGFLSRWYIYLFSTYYGYFTENYEATIRHCEIMEDYLKKNKCISTSERLGIVKVMRLNCYLYLKQPKKFIQATEGLMDCFSEGGRHWFAALCIQFYFHMSQHNLEEACILHNTAVSSPRLNTTLQEIQEEWKMFGAYLFFLLSSSGRTDLIEKYFDGKKSFKISKLLNETPLYSKDKTGYNVALIILQAIYYIQNKDYSKFIDSTDALKNYTYRSLISDETYRSHIFIKMLLELPKAEFNKEEAQEKTKELFGKLGEKRYNFSSNRYRIEVIAYEELWQIILNMLN